MNPKSEITPESLYHMWNEDALTALAKIDSSSIGAVITDPPYPGVFRQYGNTKTKLSEEQWNDLMDKVVEQVKRVLTPTGSAVFILQPVGNKIGEMSLWLPKFQLRTAENWNWIKDHYWHNPGGCPGIAGADRYNKLCRGAMKHVLWFGPADCYRDQEAVLVPPSPRRDGREADNTLRKPPCGVTVRYKRVLDTCKERGGRVPDNVVVTTNSGNSTHPATTPFCLAEWGVRYISQADDIVLDPFCGSGTVGLAALRHGRHFLGIERIRGYVNFANERLAKEQASD